MIGISNLSANYINSSSNLRCCDQSEPSLLIYKPLLNMGKPNSRDNASPDAISLQSNPGESSTSFPYASDDALDINIDDLPPNYSDALESSEAAPMLAPSSILNDNIRPSDLDARVVTDAKDGAQYWIAESIEDPESLEKYIRQLATVPPRPSIKIVGTH